MTLAGPSSSVDGDASPAGPLGPQGHRWVVLPRDGPWVASRVTDGATSAPEGCCHLTAEWLSAPWAETAGDWQHLGRSLTQPAPFKGAVVLRPGCSPPGRAEGVGPRQALPRAPGWRPTCPQMLSSRCISILKVKGCCFAREAALPGSSLSLEMVVSQELRPCPVCKAWTEMCCHWSSARPCLRYGAYRAGCTAPGKTRLEQAAGAPPGWVGLAPDSSELLWGQRTPDLSSEAHQEAGAWPHCLTPWCAPAHTLVPPA